MTIWKKYKSKCIQNRQKYSLIIIIFATINNTYKKIAPGTKGNFVIKFRRPANSKYKIKINERISKPDNLYFINDIQDTKDAKNLEKYIFEIEVITE